MNSRRVPVSITSEKGAVIIQVFADGLSFEELDSFGEMLQEAAEQNPTGISDTGSQQSGHDFEYRHRPYFQSAKSAHRIRGRASNCGIKSKPSHGTKRLQAG
jgi:hypothetical protein